MARRDLASVAALFLRFGATAFGGPAAHVAFMEDEVVRRRAWLTREEFLDLLGATNLIPGPNSTEMAIHIGHRRAGWPGLLAGGACFILPAALLTTLLAWAYVRWSALPQLGHVLYGVKPVIIAIVLVALVRLARAAVRGWITGALLVGALVATTLGVNELAVLFGAGAIAMALVRPRLALVPLPLAAAASAGAVPFSLGGLFLFFVKVGSVLFGSGYVLLAFLRADLVERWHWLTESQLLDAIAVGQVTPGPVFTTATFIGYLLGGGTGALIATIGIFLPAFVFVAISGPLVPRLRRSPLAGAFLDGVNAASLALMTVVTWRLGASALVDPLTIVLALVSIAVLLRFRVNSLWMIVAGAFLGILRGA